MLNRSLLACQAPTDLTLPIISSLQSAGGKFLGRKADHRIWGCNTVLGLWLLWKFRCLNQQFERFQVSLVCSKLAFPGISIGYEAYEHRRADTQVPVF